MKAVKLKCEQLVNPIGIDIIKPRVSWICEGGVTQTAYEVEATSNDRIIWNSGKISTNDMAAVFPAPLESKQQVSWRVRLWDENNEQGGWSEEARFEMGVLQHGQFTGKWINPELVNEPERHKPASYLRTFFEAKTSEQARLYISCHGLYEAFINGERVGNFVLAPGSNNYDKRLSYQSYDVSGLVKEGKNEVLVILGDGWYRSCSGVDGDRNLYGDDIALYFQLEADGVPVCVSDENWQATQNGPIRKNDMQQGEVYNALMEDLEGWHEVKIEHFATDNLVCSNSLPIVEGERFKGKIITTPNGETVIDYGQNMAGYIEFSINAKGGDKIIMTHGETLDENNNFTAENFQDRARHKEGGTRQRLVYTCKDGLNHYKSKFTIWGFRYAKLESDIDLSTAEFTAIAVYSAMEELGRFECLNEDINKLFHNSLWSMKSNFCDVPTDCPTRERAAWTGDMAVFVETSLFMADCYPVIRKWLEECRLSQYPDGKVANISPKNNKPTFFSEMLSGSVGWGDACIIVPYSLYKRYGDVRILEENYEMMRGWYGFLENRAKQENENNIVGKENPYSMYTIDTGVDYGEWCEPGSDPRMAMAVPQYKVATAYFAYSGRLLAEIALILGKADDAAYYGKAAENAAKAFHHVATDKGKITSHRQAEYVRAIAFGLLNEDEAQNAAKDLNNLIINSNYHLNTGFLSTPSLCAVLAKHGFAGTAYKLLLQDTMPSWLYAVKKGATTIWENWDGINEKGEVKASLNHYSYGAICGWLFGGVCGIKVENGKLSIKPVPNKALGYAKACYNSPMGKIKSEWRYEGNKIVYGFEIPPNVKADIILPDGRSEILYTGSHIL